MTELVLNRFQYLELEKLALGVFRPLTGFMNEDEFRHVVSDMRLPSGAPFPLPVVLDVNETDAARIRGAKQVTLLFEGAEVGRLDPQSIFTCDKPSVAQKLFGTSNASHPGVQFFMRGGDYFLGGPITLKRRAKFDISAFELTPEETRAEFSRRGWKTIVGFQTRNVPHRAHEYLQRVALELSDGLFIQPLIGRKKTGDYRPEAIIAGYRALIGDFLPRERVVFGVLTTMMRYAGPREAVFHAIIRRNYGCTHFIVGRDHAGVGDWYGKYEAHDLTRRFEGELGITILRLNGPYHCRTCDGIVTEKTCPHWGTDVTHEINGTDMRRILTSGAVPDPDLMRASVAAALAGIPLFIEENE
ncbi:MAG: sulfate adenylyltransferase [Hyphomicrobiales bacterium]